MPLDFEPIKTQKIDKPKLDLLQMEADLKNGKIWSI